MKFDSRCMIEQVSWKFGCLEHEEDSNFIRSSSRQGLTNYFDRGRPHGY